MTDPLKVIYAALLARGPIPVFRVSSAQAHGRAKAYPYWDVVRYELTLSKQDGWPITRPLERAQSKYRSRLKAEREAIRLSRKAQGVCLQRQGRLDAQDLTIVAEQLVQQGGS